MTLIWDGDSWTMKNGFQRSLCHIMKDFIPLPKNIVQEIEVVGLLSVSWKLKQLTVGQRIIVLLLHNFTEAVLVCYGIVRYHSVGPFISCQLIKIIEYTKWHFVSYCLL